MSEMGSLHEKEGTAGATETVGQVREDRPTFASISKKAANLRDVVELTGQDVKGLHHDTVLAALDERAAVFGVQDPSLLLDVLGTEYGLSWSTVAKMIGVTPTAIRKWRRGEQLTPQNRQRLALLLAFLELLRSPFPVADPASWLEMPISAEATLTPADLYAANRRDLLARRPRRFRPYMAYELRDRRSLCGCEGTRRRTFDSGEASRAVTPISAWSCGRLPCDA
jgi:transcriptional regulator with XRE-family HTH domain